MIVALLHSSFAAFTVQAVLIILCARLVGLLARRVGQPMVIAEIAAGIMLGPSLLGWLSPSAYQTLFPKSSLPALQLLSQVGLILFMFLIGLEMDPALLRGRGRSSLIISQAGIAVPFGLGLLLALYLFPGLAPAGVRFLPFALFIGIALSITAFPVLARILSELRLLRSKIGVAAITSAAAGDVAAWCILAVVVSLVRATGLRQALLTTLATGLFIAGMLLVVRPFMRRLAARASNREGLTQNMVALTLVLLMLSSLTTELIGIHALFGAFLLGVIIPKENGYSTVLADKMEDFVVVFLLPLFFAYSGLRTDIGSLNSGHAWLQCGLIIVVACGGKIVASTLAARLCGHSWREARALGVLMNTRGLMELVVLNLGLDLGVISPTLFTMMVLMALVTTVMTTPLLHVIYPPQELAKELAEAGEGLAPATKSDSFCLLFAVSFTSAAGGMLILAEALVRRSAAASRIYALKLLRPTERTSYYLGSGQDEQSPTAIFGQLLEQAQLKQLPLRPISFVSTQPAFDICSVAAAKGADLVVLGWHRPLLNRAALGGTVNEVLQDAQSDVAVLVDRGLTQIRRVLVPYHGTPDDQAALALARRLSEQSAVEVTVLHVIPVGRSASEARVGVHEQVSEVFREPGSDDGSDGALVTIKVVEDAHPAAAALRETLETASGAPGSRYDLVLIGVGSDWGLAQRQFAMNQEYFIRKCPTSLLVVRKYLAAA